MTELLTLAEVTALREFHSPVEEAYCAACSEYYPQSDDWPCPTARLLATVEQQAARIAELEARIAELEDLELRCRR